MARFRTAVFGVVLGVFLGATSHLFGVRFLSGTDFLIHLIFAVVGGAVGFLVDNR